MEDKYLAEHLRQYHLGEAGAVTSRELEIAFSVRGKEVRDAVNRLRRKGVPIASSAYQNQQVLFSVALFLGSLGVERKPALFMVISKG